MSIEGTIDPQVAQAMTSLGIDHASLDEGGTIEPEVEAASTEETAESEVESNGVESEAESTSEEIEVKAEGEEKTEAPIVEVPEQTAKELQEIKLAKEALETEIKALKEEGSKKETEFLKEHEGKLRDFDELDGFLAYYAEKDPEMFKLMSDDFAEFKKQWAHPVVEKVSKEMAELRKELGQFKAKASDEVTVTKLNTEIEKVKGTLGKEAEAAGIKIDYQSVKDVWADNPKLSFEEAVWAKYGAQLAKAQASKAKVAQAEKVVRAQPKVATAGSVKKSNSNAPINYKGMSWDQAAAAALKQVVGR